MLLRIAAGVQRRKVLNPFFLLTLKGPEPPKPQSGVEKRPLERERLRRLCRSPAATQGNMKLLMRKRVELRGLGLSGFRIQAGIGF